MTNTMIAEKNTLVARAGQPPILVDAKFRMGTSHSPNGRAISVDARSLLKDGQPWLPVMGEFHYARTPQHEWRDELLKMKAGGIDIVATYVFWIHHEEIEGQFDWDGQRSLHDFVQLCGDLGLYTMVRCGPWCHGECRNGGLPDWLLTQGVSTRSNDPAYLDFVRLFFAQIAEQLSGTLWKDGGPVIGIQLENEYTGPAEHLLTLKQIARNYGIDVPLYTRTGWPELSTPMPHGKILPLFGGYPDGFWDRSLGEMPPGYADNFLFRTVRNDATVATDQLGNREIGDELDNVYYPYFACEIGGGMMTSYHRRIRIASQDIAALALAKLGSGNNLQGYYMYHGGTNPNAQFSTLQESQATGYWNDLPVKTYDFQAPLGEFGQIREHYHALRRMHLFLQDFGASLATMPTRLPDLLPRNADETDTLRWTMRTDGRSGFLFVNNARRLQSMPEHNDIQFELQLAKGDLRIPQTPGTIAADCSFIWPFHLDLNGAHLISATAQPICRVTDEAGVVYVTFAQTEGILSEFIFDARTVTLEECAGIYWETEQQITISDVVAGTDVAIRLRVSNGGLIYIILLTPEQSLRCWKSELGGRERLFLTQEALLCDGKTLRLQSNDTSQFALSILPSLSLTYDGQMLASEPDGLFQKFRVDLRQPSQIEASLELIRRAGPLRQIEMGSQHVAEAPSDEDFEQATVWQIHLPSGIEADRDLLLKIHYLGDVARLYLDDELLDDNFYNGTAFELGLRRYSPEIYRKTLTLKILPMRSDAPIYLPSAARTAFGDFQDVDAMPSIEVTEVCEVLLTA